MPRLTTREELKLIRRDLGLKHGISPTKVEEIINFTLNFFKQKIIHPTDKKPIWIRNFGWFRILPLYDNPEKKADIENAKRIKREDMARRIKRSQELKELRNAEANKNKGE